MVSYSIIIPHKNTPDLLQKCLSSIPRREDVQIIVVDDNSDADMVDFEKFPGLDNPIVEVFLTKEGRGAGYARNIGLKHAVGKWLVFADADDYFLPDLDDVMNDYENSSCDIVFFKNKAVKLPSGDVSYRGCELNRRVDLALSAGDFSLAMLYSSPWQKFIKRELVVNNGIDFNEVRWGNDVVFMGKVAACAQSFAADERVVYCLTESDNSIIKNVSLESRIVRFHQECENVKILSKTKYKSEPSVYFWHFRTWFDLWKLNKVRAFCFIPKALSVAGFRFCKEAFNAKFR